MIKLSTMENDLEKTSSKIPDEEEDDEEEDDEKIAFDGCYDPTEFESLNVTSDVKNLFGFITCYTPQMIDLETKLMPFIPDYIPAVGDIDAFIKVERPDNLEDSLGLTVLDEPSAKSQSDSALLGLQLRAISKDIASISETERVVKSATSARDIDTWIQNIKRLHETTASSSTAMTLLQSQRLPDVEILMQEWNDNFENALNSHSIPTAELDCTLEEYVNIICGLLDIPVHSSKIASLHLLFNLCHEFQNSQVLNIY